MRRADAAGGEDMGELRPAFVDRGDDGLRHVGDDPGLAQRDADLAQPGGEVLQVGVAGAAREDLVADDQQAGGGVVSSWFFLGCRGRSGRDQSGMARLSARAARRRSKVASGRPRRRATSEVEAIVDRVEVPAGAATGRLPPAAAARAARDLHPQRGEHARVGLAGAANGDFPPPVLAQQLALRTSPRPGFGRRHAEVERQHAPGQPASRSSGTNHFTATLASMTTMSCRRAHLPHRRI